MQGTCPSCGERSHISSFFVEDDGKRMAVCVAKMEPVLGRAVIGYLTLFKPVKTSLRLARGAKIADEIAALVAEGTVCKDERNGVRRAASVALWAAGIETMLVQRDSLTLPLENHNYLRSVVFSLADKADAAVEKKQEKEKQQGKHVRVERHASSETPMERELNHVNHLVHIGAMEPDVAEAERSVILRKFGASQ